MAEWPYHHPTSTTEDGLNEYINATDQVAKIRNITEYKAVG